jgi:hypothetical protein
MDFRGTGIVCRLESHESGQCPVVGSCKHRNEPLGLLKGR